MAHVFQINVSAGGVPKQSIPAGEVTPLGLVGDVQRDRRFHGGPERALCLFSLEHILALQAAGHPIYPGATGENLTISGLDWASLGPGVCLQLGPEVLVEVTGYAAPCKNINAAFQDGAINEISEKKYPGRSRVYTRVLHTGTIRPGDEVQLLPPDERDEGYQPR
jgi:MOSC domain-containing protein YiiM